MSSAAARNLKGEITRWPTTESAYSGFTFGAPELIKARWEESNVVFRSAEGEEETSAAIVYTDKDVPIGDYIADGDFLAVADPTTIPAHRVRQFNRVTDLRNVTTIRKAFV